MEAQSRIVVEFTADELSTLTVDTYQAYVNQRLAEAGVPAEVDQRSPPRGSEDGFWLKRESGSILPRWDFIRKCLIVTWVPESEADLQDV